MKTKWIRRYWLDVLAWIALAALAAALAREAAREPVAVGRFLMGR